MGTDNIVHCVCDNFYCEISSKNCKTSYPCLAMSMAQVHSPGDAIDGNVNHRRTIPRQKMEHRSKTIEYDIPKVRYEGPKKPPMPSDVAFNQVPPLEFLKNITERRVNANDAVFLRM